MNMEDSPLMLQDRERQADKIVARPNLCKTLTKCAMDMAAKTVWPIQVEGADNLPEKGPYLLATNHERITDPLFFGALLFPEPLHFVAKTELFGWPVFGWYIKQLDAMPVDRNNPGLSFFRQVKGVLEDDGVVAIFTNGTRSKNLEPSAEPKSGAGYFSAKHGAPLVPGAIIYEKRLTIMRFAEPIYPEPVSNRKELDAAAEYLNTRVNEDIQRLLGGTGLIQSQHR